MFRRCRWLRLAEARGGLAIVLASTLSFSPGDARGDEEVRWTDNLFVDGGGGFEDYPFADDAQGFGWLGFNWGMPITRRDDGAAVLGAQVGGDVKLGEEDPEWNATAGLFGRGLPGVASSTDQSAAALLVDYQRTYVGNDLLALRPIVGTSAGDAGSFGATASIGLNEEEEDGIEEESVDRVGGFWNRPFGESVVGELIVGYQLGRVDEMYFQPTLAVSLTENADVGAGAQVNAAGDYAATFGFSYHFGGTRRHEWIHNVPGRGTTLYTPFPKQPLANFLQDAKRPAAPGSGTGIIGDPAVTPTNTASTSDDDSPPGAGGAGGAGGTGAPGGLGGAGGAGGTGGTGGVGGAGGAGPGGGSGGIGGGAGGSVGGGGGSGGGGADPGDDDGQGCNRGVGNGPEGCDPGNSSGKPGNAGEPRG